MLIDFHVHSSRTEGVPFSPAELVDRAKECGLDGFCLTDIHSVSSGPEARELAKKKGLLVLTGFESVTDRGHFLVFVPEPETLPAISTWIHSDDKGRANFKSLAEAVRSRNGVLIAAHPYDRSVDESPGDSLVQMKGLSAVEVLNGTRTNLVNDLAEELAAGVGLPGVGGSDGRASLDAMGKVATLVAGSPASEADLIECIRSFDIWPVTMGKPPVSTEKRRPPRGREPERKAHSRKPRERGGRSSPRSEGSRRRPPRGRKPKPRSD